MPNDLHVRHINSRATVETTENKTKIVIVLKGLDAAGGFGETVAIGGEGGACHANVEGQTKEFISIQAVVVSVPFWEGPNWHGPRDEDGGWKDFSDSEQSPANRFRKTSTCGEGY